MLCASLVVGVTARPFKHKVCMHEFLAVYGVVVDCAKESFILT